jgi:hypothetical protein
MTGTQEILQRVYNIIKPLKDFVNGDIYKEERPTGSNKEDIVLNVLASEPNTAQQTLLNVNVYVQDLTVNKDGNTYYAPNSSRLMTVENQAINYLKESYHDDLYFYCTSSVTLKERGSNEHFINFRLLVTTIK